MEPEDRRHWAVGTLTAVCYVIVVAGYGYAIAHLAGYDIPAVLVGGYVALVILANPLDLFPPHQDEPSDPPVPLRRSRLGAVLWLIGKLAGAAVGGYFAYRLDGAGRHGFDLVLAGVVVVSWLVSLVRRLGRHLRGADVDWRFLHPRSLPLTALALAFGFAAADPPGTTPTT